MKEGKKARLGMLTHANLPKLRMQETQIDGLTAFGDGCSFGCPELLDSIARSRA
jgi:hypothetical protein